MDSKILPELFPTHSNHPGAFMATTTLAMPTKAHTHTEQGNSPGLKHLLTNRKV